MKTPVLILALCTSLAALLVARPGGAFDPPAPPRFSELDVNADQYIDRDEFAAFTETMRPPGAGFRGGRGDFDPMARADTDGDGLLDEQEYADFQRRVAEMRERFWQRRGHNPESDQAL